LKLNLGAGSYREDLTETREIMAQYLNVSDASKLVIVESASTGVNAVFRSLKFEKGDKILITSTAYPMVKNLVTYFEQRVQKFFILFLLPFYSFIYFILRMELFVLKFQSNFHYHQTMKSFNQSLM